MSKGRAESEADRDVAALGRRPHEQKIGDVHARDDHDEADRAENQDNRAPHIPRDVGRKRRDGGADLAVGRGMLAGEIGAERVRAAWARSPAAPGASRRSRAAPGRRETRQGDERSGHEKRQPVRAR
jgi:hypothetical protein